MPRFLCWLNITILPLVSSLLALSGSRPVIEEEGSFDRSIRPLLKEYCFKCHSTEKHRGELDLERFSSVREIKKHPKVWQDVVEHLANNEMPPKGNRQPTAAEKERLAKWVAELLDGIAGEQAGDPGPVVLRRLSNAEYMYTVRDLTGVESLDPAREFPVDGAAGEGFTNTGQSLVVSPSLITKYLDAAKEIANHAVLLPDGIRFSPKITRRDKTDEILARIREFYREFTDARHLTLQDVVDNYEKIRRVRITFDWNVPGTGLPLEKYLATTLLERNTLTSGGKTIEAIAHERGLNAKYLATLFKTLSGKEPSLVLDPLRVRWRSAKPADAAALAAAIVEWQKDLWKFGCISHIGKRGGPKAWMEPVNPLAAKQEVRFKIPPSPADNEITLYLFASDAGDGNENDFVEWQEPHLIAPGRPKVLLRDVRKLIAKRGPVQPPKRQSPSSPTQPDSPPPAWGLDPALFGRHPNGQARDAANLCVRAPSVIEIHLPADLAAGCEFVTTGVLDKETGAEGSVQFQVLTTKPSHQSGLFPCGVKVDSINGAWTSDNRKISYTTPIVVNGGSAAHKRVESAFEEFRQIFPATLCYTKIVPADEIVTLTLFYREDHHLARLMLDEAQKAKLDRLWNELHYVSRDALTSVDVFDQIWQFATQDADPTVFEPLREPIKRRAAAFRQLRIDTQPRHVEAVLEFAERAYRRPLTGNEKDGLRGLYRKLREQKLPHDEAIRLMLARLLVSPAFLYRAEKPGPGMAQTPVTDWELANRLSYFLWSSLPDAQLRTVAASGQLRDPDRIAGQAQRMLRDTRVRRLATEFACQWLHIRDFDTLDEKSERHFPTFGGLRGAMYEESIRFFTDFFQRDRSVLEILDADYTFLNETLAKHYGIPGVTGVEWRRVDGVKKFSRGGILGQATTLAKQSGASRTSPILRGSWVVETLLGEKLPKPPKNVPRLPEDEAIENLTVRQLTEKHSTDPSCSHCHQRFDAFGYALEGFDAIGRWREKDLGNRAIDTRAKVMDGTELTGLDGLRDYLLTKRRDAFVRQFCRKLLGYSLGRAVQLSDEPLLTDMQARLAKNNYRVGVAMETIVRSRQFREIRGRNALFED